MIGYCFELRRKRRGLSRAAVAALISVGDSSVSRYERGSLKYSTTSAKAKLDTLNKQWTLEDYENKIPDVGNGKTGLY